MLRLNTEHKWAGTMIALRMAQKCRIMPHRYCAAACLYDILQLWR